MIRVDDSSPRRDYLDWLHQSRARGNVTADQTTKAVRNCRNGDGFDSIDSARNLRRRAGEIDARAIAFDLDLHANWNLLIANAIVIESVFRSINSIRNCRNGLAHHSRKIRD